MKSKVGLLQELGWNDELIKHFMIDDTEYLEQPEHELRADVFETNTFTLTCNAQNSIDYTLYSTEHSKKY